jgi:two-component system response regulator PilR (NtrC family)
VPKLAVRILDRLAEQSGISPPRLKPDALAALTEYDFPGNVRELENILERAVALCENGVIEVGDLMLSPSRRARDEEDEYDEEDEEMMGGSDVALDDYISNVEREAILRALKETRYNKTAAARKLGITFRALRYKLKKLAID